MAYGLTLATVTGYVDLRWPYASGIKAYEIQRAPTTTTAYQTVGTAGGRDTSFRDYAPVGVWDYRLRVTRNSGRRLYGAVTTVIVAEATEAPPNPEVAPTIGDVSPDSAATGIGVSSNISATFSEAMNEPSINALSFVLYQGATPIAGTVSYDAATLTATFNPTPTLSLGTVYTATVYGGAAGVKDDGGTPMAADYSWSFTTAAAPTVQTVGPTPRLGSTSLLAPTVTGTVISPGLTIVGWGKNTTGGEGGTVYTVSNWSQLKSALAASGPRIIKMNSTAGNVSGGSPGESVSVSPGDITIDGTDWHGSLRNYSLIFRGGNLLFTNMRLRSGDDLINVGEGDALTINPGAGSSLSNVVIDHCSILWSNDVTLAILNQTMNLTVQHSLVGCGLYYGTNPSSPNGYGINVTVVNSNPNPLTEYPRRLTFYRNFVLNNYRRNLKPERADFYDAVNCVYYNWNFSAGESNPHGANVVGNMFKKGPMTPASNNLWQHDGSIPVYSNSIYWSDNIGRTAAMGSFTPTMNFNPGVERTSIYGGTLSVPADPMTNALAAEIVAAAGPAYQDSIDTALKANYTNGTGTYYDGVEADGVTPSHPSGGPPFPSWP